MSPIRIYLYDFAPSIELSILTRIFEAKNSTEGNLFQEIPTSPFKEMVEFVSDVGSADAVLVPHNYFRVCNIPLYIENAVRKAESYNLPLILFTLNDDTTPIIVTGSIVLRPSVYKSKLLPQERVIPALVEDVGAQFGYAPRVKTSAVPSVGFSGMVQLSTHILEARFQLRTLFNKIQALLGIISTAEYQGLYYRRKAIAVIEQSSLCVPQFNIRNTFSANKKTIQGNPQILRSEFVESIQNSDLSLVVRGNGNYSLRLFEVLSLGRIPLFIDTDSPLPLEDIIDYDSFMIRVNYREIHKIPQIVASFWENVSPDEYVTMQKRAREVFEQYLRIDSYFKHFFTELKNEKSL